MTAEKTIAEFQARRQQTWRIGRPWLYVAASGFVLFIIGFNIPDPFEKPLALAMLYGSFLPLTIAIGRIALAASKLYRCPACNVMPKNRGKVLLDPEECPSCGARLRE